MATYLSSLDIVGSALTAQRYRTDVISQYIAYCSTALSEDVEEYQRKQVVFEERPLTFSETLDNVTGGVEISEVIESERDFKMVYDPDHPLADEQGYVAYPNVDTTEEMIDLMAASTAYEANLTALSVVKSMITKTLDMGK